MVVVLWIVDAHHLIVETGALTSLDLVDMAAGVVVRCEGHDSLVLYLNHCCRREIGMVCVCEC